MSDIIIPLTGIAALLPVAGSALAMAIRIVFRPTAADLAAEAKAEAL